MPGGELFVALDAGTTGARASAVNLNGSLQLEARQPYATSFPREGWAEQNPRDWRDAALQAVSALAARLGRDVQRVRAIGLTGQCPTVAAFDARREPVFPGLLYRDNRATAEAAQMREVIGEQRMHARTGHVATAFHVGPKMLWLREHEPAAFASTDCFLQPRDVICHALTGVTATDETHANATVFFDLHERRWAEDLLGAFELDPSVLPPVMSPWSVAGEVAPAVAASTGLPADCPVVIGAADSQCAAFGSGVLEPGPISEMAGSSSCLNSLLPQPSPDPRITHYGYVTPGFYCTELGVNVSGGALAWAVSRLRLSGFQELERAAEQVLGRLRSSEVPDPRAVAPLFLPYLGDGERDDPLLRGGFIGVSERHDDAALAYAVVEGVAFAVSETVSVLMETGSPLDELRVGGGGGRLATLGTVKAAALGRPVRHLAHDSAPVGVALLAAGQVGFGDGAALAIDSAVGRARVFEPDPRLLEPIGARYRWFLTVRESAAVRLRS